MDAGAAEAMVMMMMMATMMMVAMMAMMACLSRAFGAFGGLEVVHLLNAHLRTVGKRARLTTGPGAWCANSAAQRRGACAKR
jgi:hypothetical protein